MGREKDLGPFLFRFAGRDLANITSFNSSSRVAVRTAALAERLALSHDSQFFDLARQLDIIRGDPAGIVS